LNSESEGTALITLDSADQGLSGYIFSVYPENEKIITITGATFPSWATLSEVTPGSGAEYTIRALDLNDEISSGAVTIPLATLNLKGGLSGSTRIMVESRQIDDDLGENILVQIAPGVASVGGGAVTDPAFTLDLKPGWNLIGIPAILTPGSDTAEIFKDVQSDGHSVFSYNDVDGWKTVTRNEVLHAMNAYWIYTTLPVKISLLIQDGPITPRALNAGWSTVAIPSTSPIPAARILSSLSDWTYVIGFDASVQQYQQPIIKGGEGQNSDQISLNPGEGYWIYLSSPGQLAP
jgi:hypothetical protein